MYSTTSQNFPSATDTGQEPLTGLFLSFDQALGEVLGVFFRAGWDLTDAAGTYQSGYEGGFDFNGAVWGRQGDRVGIAYGHAHGGNSDIFQSDVVETYCRFAVNDSLALTADMQWMKDSYPGAEDPAGWIFGVRAVTEF